MEAERAFLARLQGGCQLPIGGHAQLSHNGTRLRMDALVGSPDGSQIISAGSDQHIEDSDARRASSSWPKRWASSWPSTCSSRAAAS